MSSRASGGALAASLIMAAIVGFAGGAYFGTQADGNTGGPNQDNSETAAPGTEAPTDGTGGDAGDEQGEPEPEGAGLTLSANPATVATNERIDLTGSIESAEGDVVLRLERSVDGGEWTVFELNSALTTNADGAFSTWVQTGQSGENSFRVVRGDDENVVSNEVQVAVS